MFIIIKGGIDFLIGMREFSSKTTGATANRSKTTDATKNISIQISRRQNLTSVKLLKAE